MLSENLRQYRREKGMTQEALAVRLHVTRQTISKWEKGLSVPDAELLVRLAEILEVPVSGLLGGKIEPGDSGNAIGEQLAQIAEQLAIKNRRSRRILQAIIVMIAAALVVNILLAVFSFIAYPNI